MLCSRSPWSKSTEARSRSFAAISQRWGGVIRASETVRATHNAVHLLINNAGAHFREHILSSDGLEMHLAVDYLPSFGLTFLLQDQLQRGRARVVNVASDTLRDTRQIKLFGRPHPVSLDLNALDDLRLLNANEGFKPFEAYARAKLLTVIAGYEFAKHFQPTGVTVNSVHPGIVATDIIHDVTPTILRPVEGLIRRTLLTPAQGASAALWLATSPTNADVTGRYFVRHADTLTPEVTYDRTVQQRLRESSERILGEPRDKAVSNCLRGLLKVLVTLLLRPRMRPLWS